jgi:MFS family permease
MPVSLQRRRWSLFALFLLPGLGLASWVTRTPAVRDQLGASTAEMGLVLFGLSVGSMIGILSSGPLVMRWGARPVTLVGAVLVIASLPAIALGATVGAPSLVAIGLGLFGAGMGGGEVALNVEGAAVEKLGSKPFLPALHGCFSLGTIIGAALGIYANAAGFSVALHMLLVGLLGVALAAWAARGVVPGTGLVSAEARKSEAATPRPAIWKDARLVLIGCIVLAMALAEGTANDWLPLIMVDGHGFDPTSGSTIYALFAASMTVGRFAGGPIVSRVGRARVLATSALFAAAGIALVAYVDHQAVAAMAVVLWGLGASLGFPLALSAAGDSGGNSAARVALASTVGYLAFLVGPPVLGLLGDAIGLRGALIIPLIVVLIGAALTPSVRTQPAPPAASEAEALRAERL